MTIFLFSLIVVCVAFFVLYYIYNFDKSKKIGKECDLVYEGLSEIFNNSEKNLVVLDAELTILLTDMINQVETPWIRLALRVLSKCRGVGFGEEHREKFEDSLKLREEALHRLKNISELFHQGDYLSLFENLGKLFVFLINVQNQDMQIRSAGELSESRNIKNLTKEAFLSSISDLENNEYNGTPHFSNALEKVNNTPNLNENASITLLILYWAYLEKKQCQDGNRSLMLSKSFKNLERKYRRLLKYIENNKTLDALFFMIKEY